MTSGVERLNFAITMPMSSSWHSAADTSTRWIRAEKMASIVAWLVSM